MIKRWIAHTSILVLLFSGISVTSLALDPEGKPNEDGHTIADKLGKADCPLEQRFDYFSHYSPTIRSMASSSMRKEGTNAIPYLLKGLQSGDRRVVRASCDAISGVRTFSGVNFKPHPAMTPEVAAPAVPYLIPLLEWDDPYIQAGVLQALSKCGKTAAPHLKQIVSYLKHKEWWVRVSAAYVLEGVGSPEADPYAQHLARALLNEHNIMCLTQMTRALRTLVGAASTSDAVVGVMGKGLESMERAFIRGQALDILQAMGPKAAAALPAIEDLISADERLLTKTDAASPIAKSLREDIANLTKAREAITPHKEP